MEIQTVAEAYARFYENLRADYTKEEYTVFFDAQSEFQDPFQKVKGINAIHNIFLDMYERLQEPRFSVDEVISSDDVAYLRWSFSYRLSEASQEDSFVGVSRVTFTKSAKVQSHIDYWDAGQNIYEKVPLLGSIIRLIKKRIHA